MDAIAAMTDIAAIDAAVIFDNFVLVIIYYLKRAKSYN
jgi:hypothetical protein